MINPVDVFSREWTTEVFPPERTDEFFEALFGDPEDGAYNIELVFTEAQGKRLEFAFNLHRRGSQCLACNLTSGLPKVLDRHPIINAAGIAKQVAARMEAELEGWEIARTRQISEALHVVPFFITLK
ncbi:pancreas/duodenum homeobox protein 1 [Desulfovibrio sp. OttesenSCG-928-C06]|nr:pancreas/duodenum homeobox protein 1 [Desulfovibrio sp. OttesenSCG-928-C06]